MTVGVLCGKREETGDPQRHPGGHSLRLDPKGNPGHHDYQTGWDVGMEEVISQTTSKLEYDLQAGEVPWKIQPKKSQSYLQLYLALIKI